MFDSPHSDVRFIEQSNILEAGSKHATFEILSPVDFYVAVVVGDRWRSIETRSAADRMTSHAGWGTSGGGGGGGAIRRFSGGALREGIDQSGVWTGRCNSKESEPTETDLPQRSAASVAAEAAGRNSREARARNATELRARICRKLNDSILWGPKSPATGCARR